MAPTLRDKLTGAAIGSIFSVMAAIVIFGFTSNYDAKYTLKQKVEEIDKTKAEITYVDTKCNELKAEQKESINLIRDDMKIFREDMKEMKEDLKYIINLNREIIELRSK